MERSTERFRNWLLAHAITKPGYYALRSLKRSGLESLAFAKSLLFIGSKIIPLILAHRRPLVLFVRRLGAGDIICTFPAAQRLKARHPGAFFIYNCNAEFHSLPNLAGVASVTVSTDVPALKRYWSFLFAAIYDFQWGSDGRNYYVSDEFPIEAFCRQYGVPATRDHPRLELPENLVRLASTRLEGRLQKDGGPLIVFHTGPTWLIREWPHESWCKLISRLQLAGFRNIVQIGASRNAFLGDLKTSPIPDVISLVDQLGLEETIGVISKARLLIGIDSGLLHMAAWVKTPFVGIWGPTSPQLRFSENCRQTAVVTTVACQGCHHRLPCLHWISGCQNDIACMKEISVERVLEACLAELGKLK
jgi:ADP-heptose:LPS heptosyltransferase